MTTATETEAPTHATFAEAFVAAQAEFPAVDRDGENPHFRSKFTTLGHLLGKVRPVLNRHGLSVIQLPARGEDGEPVLRTKIVHISGEEVAADAPLLLTKNDPQGMGSSLTYMRRYALASALGISDQDDDDGNSASEGQQQRQTNGKTPNKGYVGFAPKGAGKKMSQRDFFARLLKDAGVSQETADLICSWASTEYDGVSRSITTLKGEGSAKPEEHAKALEAKAREWQAKQTDTPADTSGLTGKDRELHESGTF